MAQATLDPDDVSERLESQLPDHWIVRVRHRYLSGTRQPEVVLRCGRAGIFVRGTDDGWKVTGESPALGRGTLRIAHPEDGHELDFDRCLDRAVAVARRYSEHGSLTR